MRQGLVTSLHATFMQNCVHFKMSMVKTLEQQFNITFNANLIATKSCHTSVIVVPMKFGSFNLFWLYFICVQRFAEQYRLVHYHMLCSNDSD